MKTYLKEKTIHPTIEHIRGSFERDGYVGVTPELFYELMKDDDLEVSSRLDNDVMLTCKIGIVWIPKCCVITVRDDAELQRKRILMEMGYKVELTPYEESRINE